MSRSKTWTTRDLTSCVHRCNLLSSVPGGRLSTEDCFALPGHLPRQSPTRGLRKPRIQREWIVGPLSGHGLASPHETKDIDAVHTSQAHNDNAVPTQLRAGTLNRSVSVQELLTSKAMPNALERPARGSYACFQAQSSNLSP